ncbi:hypothetical protein CHU_0579 [Cytophaga hutchinsonii ATCC 33406]|uniref:Uncharacterized protein n=1 Tax=Cytophaga hutchinsonii (strain ATCC 33406 / DSM 1761 / CIP 103989 / NBRC 15051 / NCIMB 9469 / D465) TaxID=269798 RepID=A0A6N4SNJ2_CYTH3|nr:hypothetical protein CHU_0579 [Cytophaga hutchinsonii ATCC 33406]
MPKRQSPDGVSAETPNDGSNDPEISVLLKGSVTIVFPLRSTITNLLCSGLLSSFLQLVKMNTDKMIE